MNRALRFTLLGLAVMCPGCGGGGSAMSPETWAHSFCTTLVNLQDGLVPLERSVDEQGSRSDAGNKSSYEHSEADAPSFERQQTT